MIKLQFHKDFKLQGRLFKNSDELVDFSQRISPEINSFLIRWFDTGLYVEVRTSGSTGIPKVIQLQKTHMVNSAIATGKYFNLHAKKTALLCMSPNFIAGKMMLVRALVLGWHLDVVEPVSNPLENSDKQYDFSAMVPLQLQKSLPDIHKIKKLIVGGGVVSKELLNRIQVVDTEIYATYGMTETSTHIAVKKLNNCHPELGEGSHYTVLSNIKISTDYRRCLVIEAPKVASEKMITNDLVELFSSTTFKWLGRFDTIINSGGIKLIPEQIEEKLAEIIDTRFFVTGIPDAVLGEKLILVVEDVKFKSLNKSDLFKRIKTVETLSRYDIPKEIYFLEKFIETPTKKVNRKGTLKLIKDTC